MSLCSRGACAPRKAVVSMQTAAARVDRKLTGTSASKAGQENKLFGAAGVALCGDVRKIREHAIDSKLPELIEFRLGISAIAGRQELLVDADGPDVDEEPGRVRSGDE